VTRGARNGSLTLSIEELENGCLYWSGVERDGAILELDREVDGAELGKPAKFLVRLEMNKGLVVFGLSSAERMKISGVWERS
jgi:hypothetical protein